MGFEYFERNGGGCGCCGYEAKPYADNIEQAACRNQSFRTELWTGQYLQMTLMCIPVRGEIGLEVHEDTDQYIRLEQGMAAAFFGECRNNLDSKIELRCGDAIFVPAGTWHNIINIGNMPLKISSVYAPPHHPRGTVHQTKADADRANY